MFVVIDGCDFGVVCYCCWNRMIGLATVISVEDVQSDLWQSDQAVIQNCCVCAALWNARCLMEAEHFCSIVAVSIPFLLLKLERLRFLCMTFPIFIFCYARSWWTKGKDSTKWLVVSKPVLISLRICEMDTDCPQRIQLLSTELLVGRGGLWTESSVTYALKLYVQCV